MSVAPALNRRDTPLEELAGRLDEEGYVIVEDLAPALTTRAREELAPHIEAAAYGHVPFLGFRTKRLGGLLAKSAAVRKLALHPTTQALADRLLLPHCARYQLNFSGIMHLAPGAEAQSLHRDGSVYPLMDPHPPTIMPTGPSPTSAPRTVPPGSFPAATVGNRTACPTRTRSLRPRCRQARC